MIHQQVQFYRTFGTPEFGPGKKREAQGYGRTVQRKQLIFEPEAVFARAGQFAHIKGLKK
jgi:hypothetical protein